MLPESIGVIFRDHQPAVVPALLDGISVVYADAYGKVPGEDGTIKVAGDGHALVG